MKYLFYDCECANSFDKISKICSLGYVLTDEKFNVIKKEDILINPEDIFDYHLFSKKSHIHLAYDKKDFYNSPNFKERYPMLKKMFESNDVLVFGFSLDNDIKFLLDGCKRYELEPIQFNYADVQEIYKQYSNDSLKTSLDSAINGLEIKVDLFNLHKSDDDAFFTMKVLEKIYFNSNLSSMDELFNKYNIKIKSVDDFIKASIIRKQKKEAAKEAYKNKINLLHELDHLYEKVNSNSGKRFEGEVYCFSKQVIQFAEKAIKAQKLIYDEGGKTIRNYADGAIVILGHKEKEKEYLNNNIKYIWIDDLLG